MTAGTPKLIALAGSAACAVLLLAGPGEVTLAQGLSKLTAPELPVEQTGYKTYRDRLGFGNVTTTPQGSQQTSVEDFRHDKAKIDANSNKKER